jgi:hypothetical protein
MPHRSNTKARRNGFSYLEVQVAFLLFAIGLSGLVPLTIVQSRQVREAESRLDPDDTHYMVPAERAWARKLGAAASLSTDPPAAGSPPRRLIDDGESGFSLEDNPPQNWAYLASSAGFQADHLFNSPRPSDDKAVWQFTGLQAGAYEVQVTYPPTAAAASNAPYRVYAGNQLLLETQVDQRTSPCGPMDQGVPWESLGIVAISGSSLSVELHDDADGGIVADAVRLVPVKNRLEIVALNKSLNGDTVSARVSVTSTAP